MDDLIRRKDIMKVFTISSDGKCIPEVNIDGFCTSVDIRDVKRYIRNVPDITEIDGVNIQEAIEKQIAKAVVADGDDESDWVHCPRCNEIIGINEYVYDIFLENGYQYCPDCGQKIKWWQE